MTVSTVEWISAETSHPGSNRFPGPLETSAGDMLKVFRVHFLSRGSGMAARDEWWRNKQNLCLHSVNLSERTLKGGLEINEKGKEQKKKQMPVKVWRSLFPCTYGRKYSCLNKQLLNE